MLQQAGEGKHLGQIPLCFQESSFTFQLPLLLKACSQGSQLYFMVRSCGGKGIMRGCRKSQDLGSGSGLQVKKPVGWCSLCNPEAIQDQRGWASGGKSIVCSGLAAAEESVLCFTGRRETRLCTFQIIYSICKHNCKFFGVLTWNKTLSRVYFYLRNFTLGISGIGIIEFETWIKVIILLWTSIFPRVFLNFNAVATWIGCYDETSISSYLGKRPTNGRWTG